MAFVGQLQLLADHGPASEVDAWLATAGWNELDTRQAALVHQAQYILDEYAAGNLDLSGVRGAARALQAVVEPVATGSASPTVRFDISPSRQPVAAERTAVAGALG